MPIERPSVFHLGPPERLFIRRAGAAPSSPAGLPQPLVEHLARRRGDELPCEPENYWLSALAGDAVAVAVARVAWRDWEVGDLRASARRRTTARSAAAGVVVLTSLGGKGVGSNSVPVRVRVRVPVRSRPIAHAAQCERPARGAATGGAGRRGHVTGLLPSSRGTHAPLAASSTTRSPRRTPGARRRGARHAMTDAGVDAAAGETRRSLRERRARAWAGRLGPAAGDGAPSEALAVPVPRRSRVRAGPSVRTTDPSPVPIGQPAHARMPVTPGDARRPTPCRPRERLPGARGRARVGGRRPVRFLERACRC